MEKDRLTPEERLLKIIESPEVRRTILPPKAQTLIFLRSGLGGWIKALGFFNKAQLSVELKFINKIMAFLCVCATLFCLLDYLRLKESLGKRFHQLTESAGEAVTIPENQTSAIKVSLAEVFDQIQKRNIFTFLAPAEKGTVSESVFGMVSRLKLVGIIWSNKPQAMIEDSKETKTYLLGENDRIGELEIKKIFRDKVIVGDGASEWELR